MTDGQLAKWGFGGLTVLYGGLLATKTGPLLYMAAASDPWDFVRVVGTLLLCQILFLLSGRLAHFAAGGAVSVMLLFSHDAAKSVFEAFH